MTCVIIIIVLKMDYNIVCYMTREKSVLYMTCVKSMCYDLIC